MSLENWNRFLDQPRDYFLSLSREALVDQLEGASINIQGLQSQIGELKSEVESLREKLIQERDARLSTEREKKGLSLLDLLTRSGLTKGIDFSADPEFKEFMAAQLKKAIIAALPREEGDSLGGTGLGTG